MTRSTINKHMGADAERVADNILKANEVSRVKA